MSAPAKVLVAGATGTVGRAVLALLCARGYRTRALSRHPGRARTLGGAADEVVVADATNDDLGAAVAGVEAVVSCLGAPVTLTWAERRPFHAVDTVANDRLIRAARAAGVSRFVYVAVHVEPNYARTAYIQAHERVVETLAASGLCFGVVRPTGVFPIFDPFVQSARYGTIAIPGDGTPRTNPIHPIDVAEACADVLAGECGVEVSVGGPDVLTRQAIAELAFRAVGKPPRVVHVPPALALAGASVARVIHPRIGEMLDFAVRVFTGECVAPRRGRRTLTAYFTEVAAAHRAARM